MMNAVPFPQANNLDIILDLINIFPDTGYLPEMVANYLNYEIREGQYYLRALSYIGITTQNNSISYLTEYGKKIQVEPSIRLKKIFLISQIFQNETLAEMYRKSEDLTQSKDRIDFFTKYIEVHIKLNEVTANRRASTINTWFNWIDSNL